MTTTTRSSGLDEVGDLADNLRRARRAKNLTMKDLARTCGVTQGFISQVENGQSLPSVVTLLRLADALNVDLQALLDTPNDATSVSYVPATDETIYDIAGDPRAAARVLTHGHMGAESFEMRIEPDAYLGGHITHSGVDFIFMIAGELSVDLLDLGRYLLGPRDSLSHTGLIPHKWRVMSSVAAEFICVVTPGSRRLPAIWPHGQHPSTDRQ